MFGVRSIISALAVSALAAAPAAAAPNLPKATDLGASPASDTVSVSIILKVQHQDLLESFVAASQDPSQPFYHQFLSVDAFDAFFAPSQRDIDSIIHYLIGYGISVDEVYPDRLLIHASGTVDQFNQAFAVELHDYVDAHGRHGRRPHHAPRIPALFRDLLVTVGGFTTLQGQYRPHNVSAATKVPLALPTVALPGSGTATGQPGNYTVGDVANLYDINPLYAEGLDGTGRTIGIATLANFIPDDAYTYWSLIGLTVAPDRISQVHVDGGGELSGPAGSGETSLDVEQSGGLAPGANIVVYDAPNTDQGFLDVFYRAISDNRVDSLSVSWGSAEEYYFEAVTGTDSTPELYAFHQVFLEAAAQGISMFASAGDSGAYDLNDAYNDPVNNVLSVDVPASDPAIVAAGGTTTPVVLSAGPGTPLLTVSQEQVWGWDYIQNYLVQVFGPIYQNALFPVGGGGGVSVFWHRPDYQDGTQGIRRTEPNQSVIYDDGSGPVDLLDLPAHFAGRNLPDVSLDADPETGFLLYSTEDGGLLNGYGGTSFVGPQLNGITALIGQAVHGRIGLWNPMLYRFHRDGHRKHSPLVDITAGDNWFYDGVAGYDPGAGLGVLDVANLLEAIRHDR
ncbi:MAG TPA: S53 family serine peptidase [Kofleriaceae bacterium]|nr:S53 family serine peptidase [Kofleriaceae bacterium]